MILMIYAFLLFGFFALFNMIIESLIIIERKIEVRNYKLEGYFQDNEKVKGFINRLVKKREFDRNRLNKLFSKTKFQFEALIFIAPEYKDDLSKYVVPKPRTKRTFFKIPNIKRGEWGRYTKYRITDDHIKKGLIFWEKHKKTLAKAQKIYGVPPEYIIGILSIESYFGTNTGKYPAFDSLATLAFTKHRRASFFQRELESLLVMAKSEKLEVEKINSSYAGALGWGQFMPSNFKIFCVDFDRNGVRDLWNPKDMIGSIANYFKKNGWRTGQVVAVRAKYVGNRFRQLKTGYNTRYNIATLDQTYNITPKYTFVYDKKISLIKLPRYDFDELWMGAKNFYAITRYNHSAFYAMTVHQLAQKIKQAKKRQ